MVLEKRGNGAKVKSHETGLKGVLVGNIFFCIFPVANIGCFGVPGRFDLEWGGRQSGE